MHGGLGSGPGELLASARGSRAPTGKGDRGFKLETGSGSLPSPGHRMKRILFVDDDAGVLSGLQRMLHNRRSEWDCHFADGGERALELFAQAPFDIVVSDMRMPGMDGARLLEKVREL